MTKVIQITLLLTASLFLSMNSVYSQTEIVVENVYKDITVTGLCSDGTNVWFATQGKGIIKHNIKSGKQTEYSTKSSNIQLDFFYCIDANDKYVFAGSADGLLIFDKKRNKWSKRKFGKGGQLGNWIRAIEYDKADDVVWIGRFKYLTKFDIKKRRFTDFDLTVDGNLKSNIIKTISVDGDSLVWFGTEAGLHKYNKSKSENIYDALYFYDNKFNYFRGQGETVSVASLEVEQNNIWIGLDEFVTEDNPDYNVGGLYRYNRKNEWKKYEMNTGLSGNGVFCLERTGKFIWAGLYQFGKTSKEQYGRGLAIINTLTGKVQLIRDQQLPESIFDILFDGTNIWLATSKGVFKINLTNQFGIFTKVKR
ncbi:MAG: hypothetical protein PVH88_08045 [Ignavibacteria bacterium]|jgi:hypothetical protein